MPNACPPAHFGAFGKGSNFVDLNDLPAATRHLYLSMSWRHLALFLLLSLPALAADGTFQGKVIDPPGSQAAAHGWIYVQGRNHSMRRVEISHAAVVMGSNIPDSQRRKCSVECLAAGQEVLVTAEQDGSGEWRAKRIEILTLTTNRI